MRVWAVQAAVRPVESDPEIVVVVAHPDDEVLWFSSILQRSTEVILAFGPYSEEPDIGRARAAAIGDLPFATTFIALEEAGTYAATNWADPKLSRFGMILDHGSAGVRAAYEQSFVALRDRLAQLLRPGQSVFSHNPWGEYGHPDHVLVFRVVDELRREIGFRHFVSAYFSDQSASLARTCAGSMTGRSERMAIDAQFTAAIEATYHKHGCWTWDSDWQWPAAEWFFEIGDRPVSGHSPDVFELIHVRRGEPGRSTRAVVLEPLQG